MHQASDKAAGGALVQEEVGMRDRRVPRTGGRLKPPPRDVESRDMTRRSAVSTWLSDRFVRWAPSIDQLVVLKDGAAIEVPASAEEVWDFIEDPRSTPVLQGDPRAFSFPIPGTPTGVGGLSCSFAPGPLGGLAGTVSEVVEVDPGRRWVTRVVSGTMPVTAVTEVTSIGPDRCRLRREFETQVLRRDAPDMRGPARRGTLSWLERVRDHFAMPPHEVRGVPSEETLQGFSIDAVSAAHQGSATTTVTSSASADFAASPETVLAFVDDPENFAYLVSGHPGAASSFVVAGPEGLPTGDLRCVIVTTPQGQMAAALHEMVRTEPGLRVVRTALPFPVTTTMRVEPHGVGARVTIQVDQEPPVDEGADSQQLLDRHAERAVELIRAACSVGA
jgi:carbon monoxide dehydrogenase subunit G